MALVTRAGWNLKDDQRLMDLRRDYFALSDSMKNQNMASPAAQTSTVELGAPSQDIANSYAMVPETEANAKASSDLKIQNMKIREQFKMRTQKLEADLANSQKQNTEYEHRMQILRETLDEQYEVAGQALAARNRLEEQVLEMQKREREDAVKMLELRVRIAWWDAWYQGAFGDSKK